MALNFQNQASTRRAHYAAEQLGWDEVSGLVKAISITGIHPDENGNLFVAVILNYGRDINDA